MNARRSSRSRGFTLIELVIVIAVIAILAALLVPTILGQAERARGSRAKQDVVAIAKAGARLRLDSQSTSALCYETLSNFASTLATGPTNCAGALPLAACNGPTAQPGTLCWGGPYLSTVPNSDPWNNAYIVSYNTSDTRVTVTSQGPNGAVSATDDITAVQ